MAKILVVDDEPDMIWAITNVLLSENHSVASVNSGEEALAKLREAAMDLVLLDLRLPGMDGIQILEKIKEMRPELPVIMVTGYGGIEEAVQSMKLGASHYIAKPFNNSQLVDSVSKALEINSLKSGGLFAKRLAEKMGSQVQEERKPAGAAGDPRVRKEILPFALGVFLFAAFFLGGVFFMKLRSGLDKEFTIAHSKVTGLAFSGNQLWVTDWFTQTLELYDWDGRNLSLARTLTFPGSHMTGVAAGNGALFTCDSWKKEIRRHALDERLTVSEACPSPGPEPSGLFFDGKYLWSCDGKTRKIYQHALDGRLTVLKAYETQAQFPVGLYHDGVYFWTASALGAKIYRNLLTERFRFDKAFSFEDPRAAGKPISGFTVEGGQFWLAYEGMNSVFRKNPENLKEVLP